MAGQSDGSTGSILVDRQNRIVRESRDRTGLDEAGKMRYRCRPKTQRPRCLLGLREKEAIRRDLDGVGRHRRAAAVPQGTRRGFRLRGGSTGDEDRQGDVAR